MNQDKTYIAEYEHVFRTGGLMGESPNHHACHTSSETKDCPYPDGITVEELAKLVEEDK